MKLTDKGQIEDAIVRARELLKHLENEELDDAQSLLDSMAEPTTDGLFSEIGKLTRNLHEALMNFHLDPRITDIAASEIPTAKGRLNYVIERTEAAANKTMDMVDHCNKLADAVSKDSSELLEEWRKLYRRELEPGEFRTLCKRIEEHLIKNNDAAAELHAGLSDVLLAQDYQDLTGQAIRQVITLVQDVEESMVNVIRMFGKMDRYDAAKEQPKAVKGAEGPVYNVEERADVVSGQDEVDDLLSSLGF